MKKPHDTSARLPAEQHAPDLVRDNQRLVDCVVACLLKKYNLLNDPDVKTIRADATQSGFIGLCRAAEKFDPSRGKFFSYAWPWIAKYVREEMNDILDRRRTTVSLDAPFDADEEDGGCLRDILPDHGAAMAYEAMEHREERECIARALANLPPREKLIVERHFGLRDDDERPFHQIGRELNVSAQRVQFLLKKTLATLRRELWHAA